MFFELSPDSGGLLNIGGRKSNVLESITCERCSGKLGRSSSVDQDGS
jgi:hypothetical protein